MLREGGREVCDSQTMGSFAGIGGVPLKGEGRLQPSRCGLGRGCGAEQAASKARWGWRRAEEGTCLCPLLVRMALGWPATVGNRTVGWAVFGPVCAGEGCRQCPQASQLPGQGSAACPPGLRKNPRDGCCGQLHPGRSASGGCCPPALPSALQPLAGGRARPFLNHTSLLAQHRPGHASVTLPPPRWPSRGFGGRQLVPAVLLRGPCRLLSLACQLPLHGPGLASFPAPMQPQGKRTWRRPLCRMQGAPPPEGLHQHWNAG